MPTATILPNGDYSIDTFWDYPNDNVHWHDIDEDTDSPNTSDYIYVNDYDVGTDIFEMTTIDDLVTATEIIVNIYAESSNGGYVTIDVYIAGGWLGQKTISPIGGTPSKKSTTAWAGSWTKAQVDAMRVKVIGSADSDGALLKIYAVDADITYSATAATFDQKHFRIFDDDGDINSGTPLANEDANYYNIDSLKNIRIRLEVANTGTGAGNITRRLEFKEDTGAWTQITTNSNNVRLSLSPNFDDGDATTSRLTATGTFMAGQGKESGSDTTQISLTNAYYVEDEWCIKFQAAAEGHSYQFRVTNAGSALSVYTITPTIIPAAYADAGGYHYFDSAKFPTLSARYIQGTIKTSNATYPASIRLYNITDSVSVTGSKKSTTSTSYTRIRSDSFSLTTGKEYKIQIGVPKGGTVFAIRTSYTP